MKQESRTNINRVKKDISSPDSFTPPEELKRQLITTMQSIYDEEDIEAVERAYKVAYKAHEKQKRKSGEPYIIHPICVAIILAELELDKETIMAVKYRSARSSNSTLILEIPRRCAIGA